MRDLLLLLAALIAPHASERSEARQIVDATVYAVEHDTQDPVFGSREADAAVLLYTAWRESEWRLRAIGDGGHSRGAWQVQRPEGRANARTQAVTALRLLHWSASVCPDLPEAAYLSGRCDRARRQAGRRMNHLARLLQRVSDPQGIASAQPPVPQ